MPKLCPHCSARLPPVSDAYCPDCRKPLDESPAAYQPKCGETLDEASVAAVPPIIDPAGSGRSPKPIPWRLGLVLLQGWR